MELKRILIVQVRSLLLESIVGLLEASENGDLDVVSTFADNLPDLITVVYEIAPDVIVIDRATCFTTPEDMIVNLLNMKSIRIVVLNSENNKMDIYDKNEINIVHPSDFIEALNHEQIAPSLQRGWYVADND